MKSRICIMATMLLGLSLLGADCIPIAGPTNNLTNFKQFAFGQHAALGFCPILNTVYEAVISRQDDGTHTVSLSVIETGTAGAANCRTDLHALNAECVVINDFPERSLTPAEEAELQTVFKRVTLRSDIYPGMCVDPCLIENFSWDSYSVNSGLVGCISGIVETLSDGSRDEILAFLNALRTDLMQTNP